MMTAVTPISAVADPKNHQENVNGLNRDSDGLVISIMDFESTGGGKGEVIHYAFGGQIIIFPMQMSGQPVVSQDSVSGTNSAWATSVPNLGQSPYVIVAGIKYQVEMFGQDVWLINRITGERFATERMLSTLAPDAVGFVVNPSVFAID